VLGGYSTAADRPGITGSNVLKCDVIGRCTDVIAVSSQMIMTSVVDKGLDEDYVEIERRLKIAQVHNALIIKYKY